MAGGNDGPGKTWTEEQIRNAFWSTFHEIGETWFNYLGSEEENQRSTKDTWDEFLENLTGKRG